MHLITKDDVADMEARMRLLYLELKDIARGRIL